MRLLGGFQVLDISRVMKSSETVYSLTQSYYYFVVEIIKLSSFFYRNSYEFARVCAAFNLPQQKISSQAVNFSKECFLAMSSDGDLTEFRITPYCSPFCTPTSSLLDRI